MTSFCRLVSAAAGILLATSLGCSGVTHFDALEPFVIAGRPSPPRREALKPLSRVELRDNRIEIEQKVLFELNSAGIQESSCSLLHDIADMLRKNPRVRRISIEGHASAEGDALYNRSLSNLRSRAVLEHLVKKERIAVDRLVSRGWGEEKPLASNDTEEGRENNRRVEFRVVEQDVTSQTIEIDGTTGTERLIRETVATYYVPAMPPPTWTETMFAATVEASGLDQPREIGAKQSRASK